MKKELTISLLALVAVGCTSTTTPRLLGGSPLATTYASPDGYTIAPNGKLLVSMNQNADKWKNPAKIMQIDPQTEQIAEYYTLPVNAQTGVASPLGLKFASDGNLYVSDNQSFFTPEPNLSGIIRVNHSDGAPVSAELVVTGFNMSNGMASKGEYLYCAETNLGTTDRHTSGVYRFALNELKSGDTLRVTGAADPHLILSFETKNQGVGANGIAFDSKGDLYVNNFGDCEIRKYTFDGDKIVNEEVFMTVPEAKSLDGMQIDSEDNIWLADFVGNAIIKANIPTKKITVVAKNEAPVTGEEGKLDAPSECIRIGNKVFVSNIDINHAHQTADPIQTISVIDL